MKEPRDNAPNDHSADGIDQFDPTISDVQFRRFVESVTEYAIFMLDKKGNVRTWNAGAQRIQGYSASEIIGTHFSRFYTQEDIDRGHPADELRIAVKTGRYEEEGVRVRKNGERFLASVVITPIYDGTLVGFSKVTRDITLRRKAEETQRLQKEHQIARAFLRDVLFSVTEGKLRVCDTLSDLPVKLPVHSPAIPFNASGLSALRAAVCLQAERLKFSDERANDLLIAVGEATMNAVVHGQKAQCMVCTNGAAKIQVWVEDKGAGIEFDRLHRATLERGFTTGGSLGHGFWLMLQTIDRIWLLTSDSGTTVVIEQDREVPPPQWIQDFTHAAESAGDGADH